MMDDHVLYLDNFRGFRDTFVPILDTNFLVGENSSGKTSILSLLKLMSESRLLLDGQFIAEDVDLGTFDDIVSVNAVNRDYFRIGLIRSEETPKGRLPLALLVTYEKYEGLPRDLWFSCTFDNKNITLRRVGDKCHYKMVPFARSPYVDMRALMAKWAEDHERPTGEFKKLAIKLRDDKSLLFPLTLVARNIPPQVALALNHAPLLNPKIFPPIVWVAPIRTKARRTYDELRRGFSAEGTHTPYLIRKMMDTKSKAELFKKTIDRVGDDSGLFERIEIKPFGEGGITSPFEVQIVMDAKSFNLTNVGYGVSQSLPIVVELVYRPSGTWFSIQQPEVHLHPRAQAALGGLVFNMAATEEKKFLVETHSDYLIDRYRMNVRRSRRSPRSQVLFFERIKGQNTVTPLAIGPKGELPIKQPRGYRKFFIKEQINILGM